MLTQIQFIQQLKRVNPIIHLGPTNRLRTQSRMAPVVAVVNAYQANASSANLLQVFASIGNVPQAEKIQYANAISALQQSMNDVIYVTSRPFSLHTVPANGICVRPGGNIASHQTDAILALQQLDGMAQGAALIQAICDRVGASKKQVVVTKWDFQATNKCAVVGENPNNAKTDLALALEFNRANAGIVIGNALTKSGHRADYAWLQTQVDNCPIYEIKGAPAAAALSSIVHGAGWVSQIMMRNWVTGVSVFPAPLGGQQVKDAAITIGSVLHPYALSGGGEHSRVHWSAASKTFTDTAEVPHNRPPYIALAHELIHAYHNIMGDQPGHETETYSRVLYEYCCVGLGPWQGTAMTENGVRQSAGIALRDRY